ADADHDGWNDSLEHSMANLVYPNGYIAGIYQPYILWGSNYLRAEAQTAIADDEVDSYPPDLNDDGVVDALDANKLAGHLGEGNGVPLEQISPNGGDARFYWANTWPWRRFDLDGDGYVSETDAGIVASLVGQPIPMPEDSIAPTARVTAPGAGATVTKGGYYLIRGHVWDNAAVKQVAYLVDGATVCTVTDPVPTFGFTSPFYACWWKIPKRQGPHEITIRVTDAAGNVVISDSVTVLAQ
ncbi:MAG: Ig-like domain-containing protein, partial [Gammaproteobacteria bacterium]